MTIPAPRGPAARAKLQDAEKAHADLCAGVAALALEASEGVRGAEKELAGLRYKIDQAERHVTELRAAATLAENLDRTAAAQAMIDLRASQGAEFKKKLTAFDKAVATLLQDVATLAAHYSDTLEAMLTVEAAQPYGTKVPVELSVGPNGLYGRFFGKLEMLLRAEFHRAAPERANGTGRFLVPWARGPSILTNDHSAFRPALDETREASRHVLAVIEMQIASLDERDMAKASAPKMEAA